jgi:hypothetical protein
MVTVSRTRPDVSHLMNGHFSRFTTDKLLDFLRRLNQIIEISPHYEGEPFQAVAFVEALDHEIIRLQI